MSYRNFQGSEPRPDFDLPHHAMMETLDRNAVDQAIDGVYAAAVRQTDAQEFLTVLATLLAADAVVLESGDRPRMTTLRAETPRIVTVELPNSDTIVSAVVLMRDERSREFEPRHREMLMRLAPHIARALSVRSKLQQSEHNVPEKDIDQETLQRLFRLAPSHAKLLALLVGGDQIKSAAAKLGVTEGSARQYLKKIFEKTGARRQMDLIRLADRALSRHEA